MSYLKVELLHSGIARDQRQKDTLRGLGLRRRHQQRILQDTPSVRGMIAKVYDLVRFEKTSDKALPKEARIETYRLGPVPAAKPPAEKKKPARQASEKASPKAKTGKAAKSKAPKAKTAKKK